MNCTRCGKEIPEGENEICDECKNVSVDGKKTKGKKVILDKEIFEKMKKLKKYKRIFLVALIVIIFLIICINVFDTKSVGNTIGNIRNYGYMTQSGNWIYFFSPNKESTEVGVFKIKAGDTEQKTKTELTMGKWENILSLNVSGDYLYFIGIFPEQFSNEDLIDNKIYRLKTDGTGLEIINDNEFDNDCYEIFVINDSLYYIGTDYNIYKMDLDGTNREIVSKNGTGYLGITDKYIIYNLPNETNDNYVTHIMNLDGTNSRPIIENTRLYSVNIEENYIYYTNEDKQICRVKLNGKKQEVLYDTTAFNLNVSGEYAYYLNYADKSNSDYTVCIYRVKTNGTTETPEVVKELEKYSNFLGVTGNWIIYLDYTEFEAFINLVKIDGSEEIKVYSLKYDEIYSEVPISEDDIPDEITTP